MSENPTPPPPPLSSGRVSFPPAQPEPGDPFFQQQGTDLRPPARGERVYAALARASCVTFLMAVGFVFYAEGHVPDETRKAVVLGVDGSLLMLGVISAIVALRGVKRCGPRKIRRPAVLGLALWLVAGVGVGGAFALRDTVAEVTSAEGQSDRAELTPVRHIEGRTVAEFSWPNTTFDLPPGFVALSAAELPAGYGKGYGKEGGWYLMLSTSIAVMQRRLKPEELQAAPGTEVSAETALWRGLEVNAVRILEEDQDGKRVTFNVVIPVESPGLQMTFSAPLAGEAELRTLINETLQSLAGETHWRAQKLEP